MYVGRTEIATIVDLARLRSPTHVLQTECDLGMILRFGDIRQKRQCPKTAVFLQNDKISDSAYLRPTEVEPDIETGLQGCLLLLCIPPNFDRKRPRYRSTALHLVQEKL